MHRGGGVRRRRCDRNEARKKGQSRDIRCRLLFYYRTCVMFSGNTRLGPAPGQWCARTIAVIAAATRTIAVSDGSCDLKYRDCRPCVPS